MPEGEIAPVRCRPTSCFSRPEDKKDSGQDGAWVNGAAMQDDPNGATMVAALDILFASDLSLDSRRSDG